MGSCVRNFIRLTLLKRAIRFVNIDTLSSLQIIQSESHPHSHNQGPTQASSGAKEGLSVYGLFHHLARTPQGKQLLRKYFLRPTTDFTIIKERLNAATLFLRPENGGPIGNITKSLGQIKNMRAVMINLRKGVSNGLSKSGGIKNNIWSTLRKVRQARLNSHQRSLTMTKVHIPRDDDTRRNL